MSAQHQVTENIHKRRLPKINADTLKKLARENKLTTAIILLGLFVTLLRFTVGLGGVANLDDNYPWGLWISFDLLCGVVLAAGGYATTSAYYLFGIKQFHSATRPAVTSAFLGYAFVVFDLH